jgi:hypothetical protein
MIRPHNPGGSMDYVKVVAAVILLGSVACSGGGGTPTAPPPPADTRIIRLEANLEFGDVPVGSSAERDLRIYNNGNAVLTVTGITGPSGYSASWTNGTIAPNASQLSVVRFSPTAEQSYSGTMTVQANQTSGSNTMAISGRGIRLGPRTQFGAGQHLVGTDIAPARYFSDPADGCYWERLSGLGGSLSEIIANEFIGFNARQWIVDIKSSDRAFESDPECGTWFQTPRHAMQQDLPPGVWLVGQQIAPGTYRATVQAGCYWERLRGFSGELGDIIANQFISSGGTRNIDVGGGDVGFQSDGDCGTWTRTLTLTGSEQVDEGAIALHEIEENRARHRQRYPSLSIRH